MPEAPPAAASAAMPGASGRLLGTDNLQRSVDRMERSTQRFVSTAERLLPVIDRGVAAVRTGQGGSRQSPGNTGGPTSQAPGRSNGGGGTFSGVAGAMTATGGSHRADGPAQVGGGPMVGQGGGSRRANGGGWTTAGAVGGAAYSFGRQQGQKFTANVQETRDQQRLLLNAGQYYGGGDTSYRQNQQGFRTAMNTADLTQASIVTSMSGGGVYGTNKWNATMRQDQQAAVANPLMSATESSQFASSFKTPTAYNNLRMVGINTLPGGKTKSTTQIAKDILNQAGLSSKKLTPDQINYVIDNPVSNTNQGLSNWVNNGVLTPDQLGPIKEEMRNILRARGGGMDFDTYQKALNLASDDRAPGSANAKKALSKAGIGNVQAQSDKDAEQEKRAGKLEGLAGFESGLEASTKALENWTDMLNKVMPNNLTSGISGLFANGPLAAIGGILGSGGGAISSAIGGMPIIGPGMSALGGIGKLFGGGSVNMSGGVESASGPSNGSVAKVSAGLTGGGGAVARSGGGKYGGVQPHVAAAGDEINAKFHPLSIGGVGSRGNVSDHPRGLALDFMVTGNGRAATGSAKTKGNQIAAYAVANKKRLSITYVIWFDRINHSYGGWGPYKHPSGDYSDNGQHRNHVHVSFAAKGGKAGVSDSSGGMAGSAPASGGGSSSSGGSSSGSSSGSIGGSSSSSSSSSSGSGGGSSSGGGGGSLVGFSEAAAIVAATRGGALSGSFGGGSSASASDSGSSEYAGGAGNGNTDPGNTGSGSYTPSKSTADSDYGYRGQSGGSTAAKNQRIAKFEMDGPRFGDWGSKGAQWNALFALWQKESGWNHLAKNKSSGAYGIPQALPGNKMASEGRDWKTNPTTQIKWGLQYIKDRYGDPKKAYQHSKAVGWYDKGAWNITEDQDARIHKDEMIIPANQARQIREVLVNNNSYGANKNGKGGDGSIVLQFQKESIVLSVGAGASVGDGKALAKEFVDALAVDNRIKALQNGMTG